MRNLVSGLVLSSVLLLCGAVRGDGLLWPWPMVRGTMSGSMRLGAPGPALAWRVVAQPAGDDALTFEISADGSGGHLQAHARVTTATGDGEWQVDACRLDLAPWLALLAAKFPALSGWQGSGVFTIAGHGTLRSGAIDGTATLALTDGKLRNEKKKISCEGITLQLVLAGLQPLRAEPGQELTVHSIIENGVEVRDLKISFAVAPGGEVRVAGGVAAGFGGKLSAEPFAFKPAQPDITFIVHATGLDLAQISLSIDAQQKRIREAAGHVSGKAVLHLDRAGVRLGQGSLVMSKGESARILFQPTPGLFTTYLSPPICKFYSGFEPIELGRLSLLMKAFRIKFYPDGEQAERSALIQLEGDSSDLRFPAPISEDINVNAPLSDALRMFVNISSYFHLAQW